MALRMDAGPKGFCSVRVAPAAIPSEVKARSFLAVKRMMGVFRSECRKHGILYKTDDVFRYLWTFETKQEQISLF